MQLLASRELRPPMHPGEQGYHEGLWAATMIASEFGEKAVIPLAAEMGIWIVMDFASGDEVAQAQVARALGYRNSAAAGQAQSFALSNAVICLSRIPRAGSILISELNNDEAWRRRCAAVALGCMGHVEAVDSLIDKLSDEHEAVVEVALNALVKITKKRFLFGRKNPEKWRQWWQRKKHEYSS